jgi:hypothetical protein
MTPISAFIKIKILNLRRINNYIEDIKYMTGFNSYIKTIERFYEIQAGRD